MKASKFSEAQKAFILKQSGALHKRMKAIAHARRRFGYRRLHMLLRQEGFVINHKRLFRLYREERHKVRRRGGRKRAIGTRAPMTIPMRPNERWSLDFVSDQLTCGGRFRILTVVDDCTRESLTLLADTSLSGVRVAGSWIALWPSAAGRADQARHVEWAHLPPLLVPQKGDKRLQKHRQRLIPPRHGPRSNPGANLNTSALSIR